MPFAYPLILGILETLVQMCMKGGSSMMLLTIEGQSQLCHFMFWLLVVLWLLLSIAVIWWLRKGLLNLEASRLLPVEYGTVTSTSVIGGLVLYKEHRWVSAKDQALMMIGIALIVLGCALVGRRKSLMSRRYMPHHVVAHRFLPPLRREAERAGANIRRHAGKVFGATYPPRQAPAMPSLVTVEQLTAGRRGKGAVGSGRTKSGELSGAVDGHQPMGDTDGADLVI